MRTVITFHLIPLGGSGSDQEASNGQYTELDTEKIHS